MSWVASSWDQIWPNLAANVIWVPIAAPFGWLYHRHIKKLHAKHQAQIRDIVKGEPDGG